MDKFIENLCKLKKNIENRTLSNNLIVILDNNSFLTHQYINMISQIKKLDIEYVDSIEGLQPSSDIFGLKNDDSVIKIAKVDKFKSNNIQLLSATNCIIICNAFEDSETESLFDAVTITFPKIPDWGIRDYVYSNLNIPDNAKDWLIAICKNDINRLTQEIDKLKIFDADKQATLFEEFIRDNIFSDLSMFNVFDFTNSVMSRDIKKLTQILIERNNIDLEPLGIVTLLYKNLRNYIAVKMRPNANAADLGMSDKQLYAIKMRAGYYESSKLMKMFEVIIQADEKLKTGFIEENQLIDYLLVNIL